MKRLVTTAFTTALLTAVLGAAGQAGAAPAGISLQPATTAAATDVAGSFGVGSSTGLLLLINTPSGQTLTCGNGGIGQGGVPATPLCPLVMGIVQASNSGS